MLDAQDLNQFDGNLNADANSLLNAGIGGGGSLGGGGGGGGGSGGAGAGSGGGGGGNGNNGNGNGGGGGGGGAGRNFKNNRNFGGNNQVSDTFFLPFCCFNRTKFSFSARMNNIALKLASKLKSQHKYNLFLTIIPLNYSNLYLELIHIFLFKTKRL